MQNSIIKLNLARIASYRKSAAQQAAQPKDTSLVFGGTAPARCTAERKKKIERLYSVLLNGTAA